jgi:hypothetical protein
MVGKWVPGYLPFSFFQQFPKIQHFQLKFSGTPYFINISILYIYESILHTAPSGRRREAALLSIPYT